MEALTAGTALPNLHPAVVHFPIVLLLTALGFDVAGLVLRRRLWLERTGAALFALGAAAAWVAVLTGERAADSLVGIPALVQPLIGEHHDWAERTAWVFSAIALVRLGISWRDRARSELGSVPLRWILLVPVLVGQGMLFGTADRGGTLVYGHGVAVSAVPEVGESLPEPGSPAADAPAPPAEHDPPESRLATGDDGSLVWMPLPTDAAALGKVLRPAEGTPSGSVAPAPPQAGAAGLGLEISGRSVLLLPGEFGNVQVEVEVDASAFRGSVGIVHHARRFDHAGLFQLSTGGRASLVSLEGGKRNVLDEEEHAMPAGAFTLAVSASGRHLKGMVDGATVTHGHHDPGEPGGVGLLLDGEGTIRIHSLRAIPVPGR